MAEKLAAGTFVFETPAGSPVGSVLYNEHIKLTDKSHIADFAGYLMPLWYSSIAEEHAAVRPGLPENVAGVRRCTIFRAGLAHLCCERDAARPVAIVTGRYSTASPMAAATVPATTRMGGARQAIRATKALSASAKSRGESTALVHRGS